MLQAAPPLPSNVIKTLLLMKPIAGPPPPRVGAQIVDALLQALQNPDLGVRTSAAMGLAMRRLADARIVPALVAALSDACRTIRILAAVGLRRAGASAKDALPALTAALRDPDAEVRSTIEAAINEISKT